MFRTVFLTVTLTGLRCSELQGLRWRDVSLTERTLRVVDSKSEEGRRLVAIPSALALELEQHYRRTMFKADDERVFTSRTGGKWWVERYGTAFKKALAAAGVDKQPRRLHDARHGALTAMAAGSSSGLARMHVAGHASMSTTKKYLHLAGTVFREDAERLEARQLSTEPSTAPSEPERTSHDPSGLESRLDA
jgi:integrase/recombinase XerC